jgi:hypothetical protein
MRVRARVKGKINVRHIKKRTKEGTQKALYGAGVIVQRSARKQFSHRNVKSKPQWQKVGEKNGRPVLAMEFRPPMAGKITSWKNPRGRGAARTGFLRTLIRFDVDKRRESVAIGPTDAAVWLNKLQEFGGSGPRVLRMIGAYPQGKRKNKVLEKFSPPASLVGGGRRSRRTGSRGSGRGAYVGIWVDPAHTRRRRTVDLATQSTRVPPARFMAKGLAAKRDRLAAEWGNKISGP